MNKVSKSGTNDQKGITLKLIGSALVVDSNGDHISLPNRKALALLIYIRIDGSPKSRERLASILWSQSDEEHARASLRQCLKQLKDTLNRFNISVLQIDRNAIRIDADRVSVDIEQILERLRHNKMSEALTQREFCVDTLLGEIDDIDDEFNGWIQIYRQDLRKQLVEFLERILRNEACDETERCRAAELLLRVDMTHEPACRFLMWQNAKQGNIGVALRHYESMWNILGDEYDMEPSDETQELYVKIKMGYPSVPQFPDEQIGQGMEQSPRIPILGVAPIIKSNVDVEDHLVHGFQSELISSLIKFREWIVLEGSASTDIEQADYLLVLELETRASEIMLRTRLRESTLSRTLWTEQFQFLIENWVTVQRQVARKISADLDIYVSADRISRNISKKDASLEVYTDWLKAQHLLTLWDHDAEIEAEKLYRSVIDRWPEFASAYSGIANIYNSRHIVTPGVYRTPKYEEEALRLSQKALEYDQLDARSQLTLGWSLALNNKFDQAQVHYEHACTLNPSNPGILMSAAQGLAFCGDTKSARKIADASMALNAITPPFHWGYLVGIRFISGEYEGCVEAANSAGSSIINIPGWKTAALALAGHTVAAKQEAVKFEQLVRSNWRGEQTCTEENIANWFLHCFPIRHTEVRMALKKGLHIAGLKTSHV